MKKSSIRGNFTGRENARKRAAKKRRKQREAKRRKLLRQQKRIQQPTKKKVVKLLRSIDWSLIPVIGKWIFQIALTILIAFVCVWYFGQRVSVVGDSMKPVLENGDIVLANRIVYNASKPKRGDVIIFKPKGNENSHYYIKRIIALPGESVEIVENSVYINGEKLQEDYETSKIDDVGIVNEKIKLGSDEYFVLGDDRQNSEDSRSAMVVGIPNVGKSTFINSLAGKAAAKTGNKPGVTKGKQWIRLNKQVELLDTPGILWPKFEDQTVGLRLALIGSIKDEVLQTEELAAELIRFLAANYPGVLENKYTITTAPDPYVMLGRIAESRHCLVRGNELDTEKAAMLLMDDFREGKLGRLTLEYPWRRL